MTPDERPSRRALRIRTAFIALGFGAFAFALGVNLPLSLLIALAIAAVGALFTLLDTARDATWSEANVLLRKGARREISRLSWSMSTGSRGVSESAVLRLREIATARLALRGVDFADPAQREFVEAAIGSYACRVLTSPSKYRADALLRCVRSLDELDATPIAIPVALAVAGTSTTTTSTTTPASGTPTRPGAADAGRPA